MASTDDSYSFQQQPTGEFSVRMLDDRRQSMRFPKEPEADFATIWFPPSMEMIAEVHDESLGGLGLLVPDAARFYLEQEVGMVYSGDLMKAVVRHIESRADGRYLIGFSCESVGG